MQNDDATATEAGGSSQLITGEMIHDSDSTQWPKRLLRWHATFS